MAAAQIKTVTNNVIFPIVDCVLVIMLFVKLALLCKSEDLLKRDFNSSEPLKKCITDITGIKAKERV